MLPHYQHFPNFCINSNTKLLSSDLKALHPIRELYKNRKAPEKHFDNNLILATCEGEEILFSTPSATTGGGRNILMVKVNR